VYSINSYGLLLNWIWKTLLICTFVLILLIKLMNLKISFGSFVYYDVE